MIAALVLAALAVAGAASAADQPAARPPLGHDAANYTYTVAPFVPSFEVPAPGTYELPPIDDVTDHAVIDAAGAPTTLFDVIGDRLAVVSFIYGSCAEATGCPMSTAVLHRLDAELAADASLTKDIALVTVSFDPERDTPERLAAMQAHRAPGSNWRFVTARGPSLAALLDDFGQTVSKLLDDDGKWTGVYRHVLKVYLLDRERKVRNVYSVGFLHPELVRSDLLTLRVAGRP